MLVFGYLPFLRSDSSSLGFSNVGIAHGALRLALGSMAFQDVDSCPDSYPCKSAMKVGRGKVAG